MGSRFIADHVSVAESLQWDYRAIICKYQFKTVNKHFSNTANTKMAGMDKDRRGARIAICYMKNC